MEAYKSFNIQSSLCVIHIENPTRCQSVSKFYFIFIWSSTCFGRHTAHHQQPKTALAASGFAYVEGCWTCSWWTLSGTEKSKKMLQCINILLFYIYMKLNMFRATHRPSSGAYTCTGSPFFSYVEGCWTCSWWKLSGTEKSKKMLECIKILLFHIYIKLNMFRATHRPSPGA